MRNNQLSFLKMDRYPNALISSVKAQSKKWVMTWWVTPKRNISTTTLS